MKGEVYFGTEGTKSGVIIAYDQDTGMLRIALPCHPGVLVGPSDEGRTIICTKCGYINIYPGLKAIYDEWALEWNISHRKDWEPSAAELITDWAAGWMDLDPRDLTVTVAEGKS